MKEFFADFEGTLIVLNENNSLRKFLQQSFIVGVFLAIIFLVYALFFLKEDSLAIFAFGIFFLPIIFNYFFVIYQFEERKKSIEEEIPDVLLIASSLPEKTNVSKLISFMAEHSNGAISKEFLIAKNQIENGIPIEIAFSNMKKRNKSLALNRAIDLLLNALHTGSAMNGVFRETAQDFMETNSILRERNANTTIEKYTLLLAGGIIVPLILGLLAGMVAGFNFSTISELGIGLGEQARTEIVEASLLGNIIYIFEYAIIASAFVAFQEGNQKKTILYASILIPLSFGVYFLGKGF
ncbi:MAG TPA: type II secretion system F family protein [archaeon]|nr:type II secretion system F family protein [archaeon]